MVARLAPRLRLPGWDDLSEDWGGTSAPPPGPGAPTPLVRRRQERARPHAGRVPASSRLLGLWRRGRVDRRARGAGRHPPARGRAKRHQRGAASSSSRRAPWRAGTARAAGGGARRPVGREDPRRFFSGTTAPGAPARDARGGRAPGRAGAATPWRGTEPCARGSGATRRWRWWSHAQGRGGDDWGVAAPPGPRGLGAHSDGPTGAGRPRSPGARRRRCAGAARARRCARRGHGGRRGRLASACSKGLREEGRQRASAACGGASRGAPPYSTTKIEKASVAFCLSPLLGTTPSRLKFSGSCLYGCRDAPGVSGTP